MFNKGINKKIVLGILTVLILCSLVLVPTQKSFAETQVERNLSGEEQEQIFTANPVGTVLNLGGALYRRVSESGSVDEIDAWCKLGPFSICGFVNALFLGPPYLIGYVGAKFLTASSYLVDMFFGMNTKMLTSQNAIIAPGFAATLAVANLGFIIALIIIAFATILRIQEYSAKKLLGKLIIYAVLINFSIFFAGLILDFSHVLSLEFFPTNDAAGSIASGLNVQQYLVDPLDSSYRPNDFNGGMAPLVSPAWWRIFTVAVFMMAFAWIMFFIMLAIAIMLLVRYVSIIILVILMPLAWVTPLLPRMQSLSKRWWDAFLRQAFFLPAAAFFIYLATKGTEGLSGRTFFKTIKDSYKDSSAGAIGLEAVMDQLLSVVIVGGLLIGALKASSEIGGASAKIGLSVANKVKKTGLKYGVKPLGKYAMDAGTKSTRKGLSHMAAKGLGFKVFGVRPLNLVPGAKTVRNKLMGVANWESEVAKYKKDNLSNLNKDQLLDENAPIVNNSRIGSAGLLSKYIDEGLLNDASTSKLQKLASKGKNLLTNEETKKLLATRPDMAEYLGKGSAAQAVRKMPPSKIADWDPKLLDNEEIFFEVVKSKALLRSIAMNGSEELRGELLNKLKDTKAEASPEYVEKHKQVETKIDQIETAKTHTTNPKELDKLENELEKFKKEASLMAKNIDGIDLSGALEYVNQTISGKTIFTPSEKTSSKPWSKENMYKPSAFDKALSKAPKFEAKDEKKSEWQ